MNTIISRLEKLEEADKGVENALDRMEDACLEVDALRESMLDLYRFISDTVGAHDPALERRLKGGNRNGAADHPIKP